MASGNFNHEEYRIIETLVNERAPHRYANMYNQTVLVTGLHGEGKKYTVFAHTILNHTRYLPR
jgi:hypothetical protein